MRSRLFSLPTLANYEDAVYPKLSGLLHQAWAWNQHERKHNQEIGGRESQSLSTSPDQALSEAGLTLDVFT